MNIFKTCYNETNDSKLTLSIQAVLDRRRVKPLRLDNRFRRLPPDSNAGGLRDELRCHAQ